MVVSRWKLMIMKNKNKDENELIDDEPPEIKFAWYYYDEEVRIRKTY